MTPSLFTYTWLLPFGVLVSLSTGELEFYQDTSDDIGLKQLATYIAKQNRQQQQSRLHRSYVYPLLTPQIHKKHYVSHDHQKERDILEALKEKLIDNALREENLMALNYRHQTKYDDSVKDALPENKYEYYDSNPMSKNFDEYPDLKIPYQDKFNRENSNNDDNGNGYLRDVAFLKQSQYDGINMEGGTERGTMSKFRGNHYVFSDEGAQINGKLIQSHASIPEFTFKFDDTNIAEKNPFAVKPNDPRYYLDEPFSAGMDLEYHEVLEDNEKLEREKVNKHTEAKQTTTTEYDRIKNVTMDALAEAERRAGYHPLIVPVSHDLNNDIYFIAIVAGCSAAAMFALVLISLTWCRLQRGVKAAADIEYPAYGVTGPNKDVSPSGDQRLAQSAQMYHFQHQKQQIIAMENRTSATRDPGSVSEAESDEENEEGDYTVYECPGLAPTGEMEVKNPLFHDDPTPATSTHTNKEEDHM